jgi:hypothetical protein
MISPLGKINHASIANKSMIFCNTKIYNMALRKQVSSATSAIICAWKS